MPPESPATPARPFTVLVVCTGNVCRSPAVERLLAAELDAATAATGDQPSQVVVTSAGVGALVGDPMPEPMAALVRSVGVSPDGFAARQLTERQVREADLVLALTRAHRARVVALHPACVRRTFILRELARLARGVDPGALPPGSVADRLRALIPLAAAQRGLQPGATDADDDVVDPYGGDKALYARSFEQLRPAVSAIADVVRP